MLRPKSARCGADVPTPHEDGERVRALARALQAEDWSVWIDEDIRGGAEYARDIQKELEAARVVIVAWSARAIESTWVKDEAEIARERGGTSSLTRRRAAARISFRRPDWASARRPSG